MRLIHAWRTNLYELRLCLYRLVDGCAVVGVQARLLEEAAAEREAAVGAVRAQLMEALQEKRALRGAEQEAGRIPQLEQQLEQCRAENEQLVTKVSRQHGRHLRVPGGLAVQGGTGPPLGLGMSSGCFCWIFPNR